MGKKTIITKPGCPACHMFKRKLLDSGKWSDVERRSIAGSKGKEIADKIDAKKVPACVEETMTGDYKECDISDIFDDD